MADTKPLRIGDYVTDKQGRTGTVHYFSGPLVRVQGVMRSLRHASHWYFPIDVRPATKAEIQEFNRQTERENT